MDKDLEYQYLSQVFGSSSARQFEQGERPDFTFKLSDGSVLGVEITSVFASNSAAKLARSLGYSDALLRDPSRLHRADQGQIDVLENATVAIGQSKVTGNVLKYKVPSILNMLERLKELIIHKSRKISEYRGRCATIDLIVADDDGTLYWQHPSLFRLWLSHFLPRATLLDSEFREIYLNIPTLELGDVAVAMKGSLFVSDFHSFTNLTRDSLHPIAVLCECLRLSGYGDAHVLRLGDVHYFRRNAWVIEHQGETFTARDMRLDLRHDPQPTLEELSARWPARVKVEAAHLVKKRSATLGGAGLLLVEEGSNRLRRREGQPHFVATPRLKLWTGQEASAKLAGHTSLS